MRLAVIPGDGIGPEVVGEALKVLDEVAPSVETTQYDLGAARWHSTGELLPESGVRGADHALIGRAGGIERDFAVLRAELAKALGKIAKNPQGLPSRGRPQA